MALYFRLTEVGSDVVFSGSGVANTASFGSATAYSSGSIINAGLAELVSTGGQNGTRYTGISGPVDFGPGGVSPSPNTSGGDSMGVQGFNTNLLVPTSYVSNTQIDGTATWNGYNFASLGLTEGTYTWTWGSGGNADSLTLLIGDLPTPTPTPTPTNTPTTTATSRWASSCRASCTPAPPPTGGSCCAKRPAKTSPPAPWSTTSSR